MLPSAATAAGESLPCRRPLDVGQGAGSRFLHVWLPLHPSCLAADAVGGSESTCIRHSVFFVLVPLPSSSHSSCHPPPLPPVVLSSSAPTGGPSSSAANHKDRVLSPPPAWPADTPAAGRCGARLDGIVHPGPRRLAVLSAARSEPTSPC